MDIITKIKAAGVVGAGGAGFPTHVKADCKADVLIANGAECEPLLQADQTVMRKFASEIIAGLEAMMTHTGAAKGIVCTKKHYHEAVRALEIAVQDKSNIEIKLFDSYYPAGDEQSLVFEITGKVVPTGGIPLDVGAVVVNVSTLKNIAFAMNDIPVTEKFVTVTGEVGRPMTVNAPVGTPFADLIHMAEGTISDQYKLIIGGPCMGTVSDDFNGVVTKVTGGIIVLDKDHLLIDQKKDDLKRDIKLARAVCCQCSLCTQICPRNAMGLNVLPHKAMRAAANGNGALLGDFNGIFSCCDCGLCTMYACNFGLNPSKMMARFKDELRQSGVKPKKEVYQKPDAQINLKRIPVSRLTGRLNIQKYDVNTAVIEEAIPASGVKIKLSQHIGLPAEPCVIVGQRVKKGELIGKIPEGNLGANVHASISGEITEITSEMIVIARQED